MTLYLPQGPSYLTDPEHRFAVFCYDFETSSEFWEVAQPRISEDWVPAHPPVLQSRRRENYSRLYPHILGMLGHPGDGLVIAQKLPDGHVHVTYGYVGWNGFPVFQWNVDIPAGDPGIWKTTQRIGLGVKNVAWIKNRIDHRTRVVRAGLMTEWKRRLENLEAQRAALKKSKSALYRFRYRQEAPIREERRRQKTLELKARQEEKKRLAEKFRQWKDEVLNNLQAIQARLRLRQILFEQGELFELESYL